MKRRLLTILLFLLLGAAVNVAVACACARLAVLRFSGYKWDGSCRITQTESGFQDWFADVTSSRCWARVHSSWGVPEDSARSIHSRDTGVDILPSWAKSARPSGHLPPGIRAARRVEASGWPMLAMRSQLDWTMSEVQPAGALVGQVVKVTEGLLLPSDRTKSYQQFFNWVYPIPTTPIWPGSAVNIVFYGVILWMLLHVAPCTLRRQIRRRRGRCVKCGYDLRGDLPGGCPECGWNRAKATT